MHQRSTQVNTYSFLEHVTRKAHSLSTTHGAKKIEMVWSTSNFILNLSQVVEKFDIVLCERSAIGNADHKEKLGGRKIAELARRIVPVRSDKESVVHDATNDDHNGVFICSFVDKVIARVFHFPTETA